MITITFLKHLKTQLRIYEILHCTCYLWDKNVEKVVLISKLRARLFYYLITFANALYALAMIFHLAFNPSLTLVQRCAAMPFFGLQFTSLWFRWSWRFEIDPKPANVINTMMKYEMSTLTDSGRKYEPTKADKLIEFFLPMVAGSCLIVPLLVPALLWMFPCTPPFIGSMLSFCSFENLRPPFGLHLFILAFELINFYMVCCQGGFYLLFVLFSGFVCLTNYLLILQKDVDSLLSKKKNKKKLQLQFSNYKRIHLLCEMFNDCTKFQATPALMVSNPAIQIFSGFVTVKLHHEIPMPGFLYFPIQFIDCCVLGIGILTVASYPWEKSNSLIGTLKQFKATGSDKFSRKMLRSLFPIKVMFGNGNNFIDKLTPLIMQDFVINQTVSLLLLT